MCKLSVFYLFWDYLIQLLIEISTLVSLDECWILYLQFYVWIEYRTFSFCKRMLTVYCFVVAGHLKLNFIRKIVIKGIQWVLFVGLPLALWKKISNCLNIETNIICYKRFYLLFRILVLYGYALLIWYKLFYKCNFRCWK